MQNYYMNHIIILFYKLVDICFKLLLLRILLELEHVLLHSVMICRLCSFFFWNKHLFYWKKTLNKKVFCFPVCLYACVYLVAWVSTCLPLTCYLIIILLNPSSLLVLSTDASSSPCEFVRMCPDALLAVILISL